MVWDVLWSFIVFVLLVAAVAGYGLREKTPAAKQPEEKDAEKEQRHET
jgi:cytochrome c-type biogenesis protein CcmH/NrfF